MKLSKSEIVITTLIAVVILGTYVVSTTLAEQSGGSPESGEHSVLMDTYDTLVGLGYGSETGSNGSVWNRIISSATWVPDGTVTEGDVREGVGFYEGTRSLKTGTLKMLDWEKQSLLQLDNRDITDYGETSSWVKTNTIPEVWYDEVTGLYWSAVQGSMTNEFSRSLCGFYSTVPRGDYNGGDVTNCGNAIETCATLSLDANGDGVADNNWYLPSQLELMQAYVNGIYKKTSTSWVGTSYHWSSTELQGTSSYAWNTYLNHGYTNYNSKTNSYSVRCVLRDL
jgi:hypothetical protein